MNIAVVGAGRAGTSFSIALTRVGHRVNLAHHEQTADLGPYDVVILAVPDDEIEATAQQLGYHDDQVVAHVAGSRTLAVLGQHPRVGSMHPLATLPSGECGASRLIGATYAVAGDERILRVVESLDGRVLRIADERRTAYHATATVAANHVVALMGHVSRLAESAGLELADFWPLVQMALADVVAVGPAAALTGPASRGDTATIDAHLAAILESERSTYLALANAALSLAERRRSQTRA